MREYAEDNEVNCGQYEFPEVEKALPECIRNTLKREDQRGFIRRSRLEATSSFERLISTS